MYTIAGKFKSSPEARRVYIAVDELVQEFGLDAYVSRLRSGNNFYVAVVSDAEISQLAPDVTQTIHDLLSRGQVCQLPPEALAVIEQRRKVWKKRQEELRLQQRFREDRAAYLAELEERFINASSSS